LFLEIVKEALLRFYFIKASEGEAQNAPNGEERKEKSEIRMN
jgi:hypothetical protein